MPRAALVSPTQYSQMLWAILINTFSLHIDPELSTLFGIALINGSGF